jgi:hypothetical protein
VTGNLPSGPSLGWRRRQVNGAVPTYLEPRLWLGGCHDRLVASGACAAIMSDEQMLNENVNPSVPLTTQFSIFVNGYVSGKANPFRL